MCSYILLFTLCYCKITKTSTVHEIAIVSDCTSGYYYTSLILLDPAMMELPISCLLYSVGSISKMLHFYILKIAISHRTSLPLSQCFFCFLVCLIRCSVKANQNKSQNSTNVSLIQTERCKSSIYTCMVTRRHILKQVNCQTSVTFLWLELAICLSFNSAIKKKFYKDILPVHFLADQITAKNRVDRIRKEDLNVN